MIGLQMSLPECTALMAQTRTSVGFLGEVAAARAFEASGYRVDISHENGDLHVIDHDGVMYRVEVKTARRGKTGRWGFCLYKKGSQNHRNSDFVVLLALGKTGFLVPFVVPIAACKHINVATISSWPTTYQGWLSQYRQSMRKLKLPEIGGAE